MDYRIIRSFLARLALNIGSLLLVGATSGVTVCLVVLMALLFYQMSNAGSVADWVSSLCNVAMALTAFGALIVAPQLAAPTHHPGRLQGSYSSGKRAIHPTGAG